MSKTIIQDKIHISISDAINYIDNLQDKDNVDIGRVIYLSIGNVISLILFGSMYKHDNSEEFFNFINNLDDSIKKRASAKPTRKLKELTNQQIELIKKDFDPNNDPPNFIHAVMKEIQAIDSKYSYLNSDHLNGMVLDFWTAGTETTSTTIKWLLLFAMKYLDIQEKLHNEIDEVIGRDHLVLLSDKNRMPYMSAFIAEGQRFANIVPFVPFHKCTIDTVINGRLIPKDTLTQPFFWSANVDEKYFKDPYTFNPNRFLSDDGKKFNPKHDHLSFGLGKRSCVGKSLAEAELFLMFTSLLQKYKFTHINGPVDLSYDFGDVSLVRPYKCKIEKR
uniref:Cytochrome P450 n=1 Tax=Strongyloides stercoralis TaxID=6248 RepID=A0AAF5DF70_STRER